MAKKRINKETLFLITSFVVCFSLVSFMCLVFPGVKVTNALSSTFGGVKVDGIKAVFGGTVTAEINKVMVTVYETKFNFFSLLGYLLPVVGGVFAIFGLKKLNLLHFLIASAFCIVGGVLILFEAEIFRSVNDLLEYETVTLLFGPIMGGITAIVAGLIALGSIEIFNK